MLIAPDVSYYQRKVDDSFNRQWLIFRGCDGGYMDENAAHNAAWCRNAKNQGRLLGHTTYVVYRPGENAAILNNLATLGPLHTLMVDVESWAGQIRGDHSDDINSLVLDLEAVAGHGNVWVYGNTSDLGSIYPRKQPGQLLVVAGWGPDKPNVPNMIGWQYTDGAHVSGARPLSSPPFGNCDHNEIYVDELAPSGGGTPIPAPAPAPKDDDMPKLEIVQLDDTPEARAKGFQSGQYLRMDGARTWQHLNPAESDFYTRPADKGGWYALSIRVVSPDQFGILKNQRDNS